MKTVLRLWSTGWSTASALRAGLVSLGVRRGGVLLVHSSLSSLGYIGGGAETVIDALSDALGPEGTLVMPSHSWEAMEAGERVFNVRETPSCVGTISERFRRMKGVVRSLHPTHSVAALGPRAHELVVGHEQASTPCGAGSPYARLGEMNGQCLFLGVTLRAHTMYHTVEAMAGAAYLLKPSPDVFTIVDQHGMPRRVSVWRHEAGVPRRFEQWESLLSSAGVLKAGYVGRARTLLLESPAFVEFMIDRVRRDPGMLLSNRGAAITLPDPVEHGI